MPAAQWRERGLGLAERLSLIAGSGGLVAEVLEAAQNRGFEIQVLSVGRGLWRNQAVPIKLGDPARLIEAIKSFGTTTVAMAGGLQLNDSTRERLAQFLGAANAGSLGDGGLSLLARKLTEMTGARVVGVHEIAPELLAPEGLIAGAEPDATLRETAAFALSLAKKAGVLDLGQAVVVSGRRAIASEDIAGTDALLKRVQTYRAFGLVAEGTSPLMLAKAAKPTQPYFVDLPAIGPTTVAKARKAGVRAIVVEAGATLLIERRKLAAAADAAGMPVLGLSVRDG
jgi:UDP-2,3-diacylglucosamine hydrolase